MAEPLPFDGAISQFYESEAPDHISEAIRVAGKKDMLNPDYPYRKRLRRAEYEARMHALQIELAKMQADMQESGKRLVVVFEGRDAAGKGGTIKRLRENLNPRSAHVAALAKPSDTERGEWYFQRYVRRMPTSGEIVFFDRSWYNRAVIEHVFGFCTPKQREHFFRQTPNFEELLVEEGIRLCKIWLTVGRAEQLRRFLAREGDILKQWKLSSIDVKGLSLWHEYSAAIEEMFQRSHTDLAPWNVIRSDDKRRARLAAIQLVLGQIEYKGKNRDAIGNIDTKITGSPELMGIEAG